MKLSNLPGLLFCALLSVFSTHQGLALEIGGDEDYPPYTFVEGGQFKGIYVDFIRQIVANIEGDYQVTAYPWKRGLGMLENKDLDALFPPYYRPEERPYMRYSDPIYNEQPVFYCNKQLKLTGKTFPEAYIGLRIGRNSGFITDMIDEASSQGLIRISEAKSANANLMRLLSGRLDCYVNDRLSLIYELNQLKKQGWNIDSVEEVYALQGDNTHLAIHISSKKEIQDFLQAFNRQMAIEKKRGTFDKLIEKYLNR